jgi:predicted transcriptional regulator
MKLCTQICQYPNTSHQNRTITRLLDTENNIIEVLQDEGLLTFLNDNKNPKKVWLSEDGSRIIEKIQFDIRNNSLVGVVLPFDKNGMPILERYKA